MAPGKTGAFFFLKKTPDPGCGEGGHKHQLSGARGRSDMFKKNCFGLNQDERGGGIHPGITRPKHKSGSGRVLPESPKTQVKFRDTS